MKRLLHLGSWALVALSWTSPCAAQSLGNEFQANSYTTGNQIRASVGAAVDGGFVVVWNSFGSSATDDSSYSVQGQRYASDGTALGASFQVNSYTLLEQYGPEVAVEGDGDFVVTWWSASQDGSGASIQARRYGSDGTSSGDEFLVNTYSTSEQRDSSIGIGATGEFVIVWRSLGSALGDTSSYSVQARRFSADGSPRGLQFQANTYTTNQQYDPVVAVEPDGDFMFAWQSNGSSGGDTSLHSIQARRYASDGTPRGSEFQVNSYTTGDQYRPAVAALGSGDFVVVWDSSGAAGGDTGSKSVQARRFASDGSARGAQFQVNTYTTGTQYDPSISADPDGDFVVSWSSRESSTDSSYWSVHARRYSSDGLPKTGAFQVNEHTLSSQFGPAVAVAPSGDATIAWTSHLQDGDGWGIFGRRITFADITISDCVASEDGGAPATFTVTAAASTTATVDWATAAAGATGADFESASGRLTLAPGETETIAVSLIDDAVDEGAEYFHVNLLSPSGTVFADVQARCRIDDDDPTPTIGFSGVEPTVLEVDSGTVAATFSVSLSAATERTVEVTYATGTGGTATSNVDYQARTGVLRFLPGQTTKDFKVFVNGDTLDEATESFFVNLSTARNATFGDRQAKGTIMDDDPVQSR